MSGPPRLSFMICGVQKGGTTALWHFLRSHPQIGFGPRKEMHFFDDESRDWSNPSWDDLERPYAHHPAGRILGDATPIYTYWPSSLGRIHRYNPGMRLIVSLRHPVERAYSHWRMATARGQETLPFGEAIRAGRRRLDTGDERALRVFSYVERGFYTPQLDRLFALFPASQVLLLRQADLQSHPAGTLNRVYDFLGLPRPERMPAPETVFSHMGHAVAALSAEDAACLQALHAGDLRQLRARYGIAL